MGGGTLIVDSGKGGGCVIFGKKMETPFFFYRTRGGNRGDEGIKYEKKMAFFGQIFCFCVL